ncbi:Arc family DNA-binding protein [Maritalea porphyrae]|uniref:Arc family DNA-binding protein n=1 Tax=Maritalea porphyrae TaxID=880732 RepID=UPI0022AF95FE|nr:Arc family DNA-binding protein [Maritalea porphyrae]MCZ4270882.1 Arc family DNA-binding protein [Maritalea porphyrae]
MPQDSKSRKLDQYIVRFPDGMRQKLKDIAAENGRSLNAEIIHRLEQSFNVATSIEDIDAANKRLQDMMDKADKRIAQLREQNTLALQVEMNRRSPEDSEK